MSPTPSPPRCFLPPALFAGLVAPILITLAIEQAEQAFGAMAVIMVLAAPRGTNTGEARRSA